MNPQTTGFGGVYRGLRYDIILANPPFAGAQKQPSTKTLRHPAPLD
jgi:hypothetical protein